MRRSVLLVFGLSLLIVRAHCHGNTGPIVNKINALSDELAQVKRDLVRVEDKITIQIDFAKISIETELIDDVKQNLKTAIAEVLGGESIHEVMRNQVVSEVRQLRRGNMLLKRQLQSVQNSLRNIQKRDSLEKSGKHSGELKCVVYREDPDVKITKNFNHSHKHLDQSISDLSLQLESTRLDHDSLYTTVSETREDLLLTRSDMNILQASASTTMKDVSSTKRELAQIKTLLEAAKQDFTTTKSEIKNVKAEADVTKGDVSSTKTKLIQLQALFEEAKQDLVSAKSKMKTVQRSVNASGEDVSATKTKLTIFEGLLLTAKQDITSAKSELQVVSTSLGVLHKEKMATTSRFNALQNRIAKLENTLVKYSDASVAFEVTQVRHPKNLPANQNYRFDSVVLNEGGGYHSGTGIFTAPVSGTYLFWSNILPDGGALHTQLFIEHSRLFVAFSPSKHIQCSLTFVVKVKQGQKVWFGTPNYSTQIHGDSHSAYGGILIRSD